MKLAPSQGHEVAPGVRIYFRSIHFSFPQLPQSTLGHHAQVAAPARKLLSR
eukprot:CAMPEP_0171097040 /NCGR_PEP_ID=MMETSP0766_2-20121228/46741_1 /TAXON_ID=439317 /ORGANISM="Gambierdiscus australes, Strain CAWD 149" /LENGTH=50 /DNA_ID=CAMNT_0011556153 /DNA_START=83 /DNA_END=235 /DNA_ORIENTATION=-